MQVPVDDLIEQHLYSVEVDMQDATRWITMEFVRMTLDARILWLHFRIHAKGTPWDGCRMSMAASAVNIRRSIHELDLFDEMTP